MFFGKKNTPILVGIISTLGVLLFLVIVQNVAIIQSVVFASELTMAVKFQVLVSVFLGYIVEVSLPTVISMVIAILFGLQMTLIMFMIQKYKAQTVSIISALSGGSMISAVLGIGCLSCGSLITAALASVLGTSSVLILLPFDGLEFSIISVLLLSISIGILYKKLVSVN